MKKEPLNKPPPIITSAIIGILIIGAILYAMRPAHEYVYEVPRPPMPSMHAFDTPGPSDVAAAEQRNAHDRRMPMKAYWDRNLGHYTVAKVAMGRAMQAVQQGDFLSGSQLADKVKQYGFDGANESANDVPEGWDEVHSHLSNAFAGLADAGGKFADALDEKTLKSQKAAIEAVQYEQTEFADALHLARESFKAAGGNGSDLSDGVAEYGSIDSLLDTFAK